MSKAIVLLCALVIPMASGVAQTDSSGKAKVRLLPYLTVGGVRSGLHYKTLLFLGNPTGQPNSGVIDVYDNSVEPLPISLNHDRGMMSRFSWELGPERVTEFELTNPNESALSGWVRVEQSGKGELDLFMVVQLFDGESLVSQNLLVVPNEDSATNVAYTRRFSASGSSITAERRRRTKESKATVRRVI